MARTSPLILFINKYRIAALWLALSLLAAILYLWPFLQFPAFNVIDDGASLWVSKQVIVHLHHGHLDKVMSLLFEFQEGRIRPVYHLYSLVIYSLFGIDPLYFWIGQVLLLGLTLSGMSLFVFLVTRNKWLAGFFPLLLLIFVPTADNFYRLGTAEPKQVLLWLGFFLWCAWVRHKGWTITTMISGLAILWACLLTKETSIVLIPVFWLFWLWQIIVVKQRSRESLLYGLTIGLLISSYVLVLPPQTGYSTSFTFIPVDMWLRFKSTLGGIPVLYLALVLSWSAALVRCLSNWKVFKRSFQESEYFWTLFLGLTAIFLLVIGILPWQWPLSRYFYPLFVLAILAVAIEIQAWINLRSSIHRLGWKVQMTLASLALLTLIIFQNALRQDLNYFSLSLLNLKQQILIVRLDIAEIWQVVMFTLLLMVWRYFLQKKRTVHTFYWQMWLVVAIGVNTLASSLVWTHTGPLSYTLTIFLATLLLITELKRWWPLLRGSQKKMYVLGITLSLIITLILRQTLFQGVGNFVRLFSTSFFQPTIEVMQTSFDTYQISYGVIKYVLETVPAQNHIYVWENEYEILFEIGLFASQLGQKPVNVYTNSGLYTLKEHPYFEYSPDPLQAYLDDPATNKILLTRPLWWESVASSSGTVRILPPANTYHSLPENIYWQVVSP